MKINLLEEQPETKIARPLPLWQFALLFFVPIVLIVFVFFVSPRVQKNNQVSAATNPPTFLSRVRNFVTFFEDGLFRNKDQINVLILGKGGADHEGPNLTDTIIVVSIKPKTGETALISIPRDLYVELPKWGSKKINSAYALEEEVSRGGGAEFTSKVIQGIFGVPIHYYIVVNFDGFRDLVNAVGGIRVYVDRAFTDQGFPTPNFKTRLVSFEAGWQVMTGERALQFARSRHGSNGESTDFARARRQQKIILAIKDKILTKDILLNPPRLIEVTRELEKFVETDVGLSNLWHLIKFISNFQSADTKMIVLSDAPDNVLEAKVNEDGAYILVPKNNNWKLLRDAIKNVFE